MPRYRLTVEYDGTPYMGWQRQPHGPSVQGAIERAITAYCGEIVTIYAAGRTDTGVHSSGQVIHFDLQRQASGPEVRDALNHFLKEETVAIVSAEETLPYFHARFSAIGRSYLYRIVNRRAPLVLDRLASWWLPRALNVEAMAEGAKHLLGGHDFTSFRATECQSKSPFKSLNRLDITRRGDQVLIEVQARSFLHHQVRNIVGTLKLVGDGKWTPADVKRILEARDRRAAGPTAPARGLTLTGVDYPEVIPPMPETAYRPAPGEAFQPRRDEARDEAQD